jgi:hypothetical protein
MMHMVFYLVKLLNYFPAKGGVSEIYGPKTIMSGKIINFKKFPLPFGTYCQVHEEKLPRNSLADKTLGAISLGPSRNAQGGHKFFTLNTSRVITCRSWDVIPMPKSVVDRVNYIGRDEPIQPVFLHHTNNPIGDGDADYEEDPANPTVNLPGEVIPEVAPDHVKITRVDDAENAEPFKFQADLTSPVEIPGVDTAQKTIEINNFNLSPPQEPALIEPAKSDQPRLLERECKAMQKYAPSMSGKSYAYTQLGLLFLRYAVQVFK